MLGRMESEVQLTLTSLSIDGRPVPIRAGQFLAIRRTDVDGLQDQPTGPAMRNWSAWVSTFNMVPINGLAVIAARSREGRWLEGPAAIMTTTTPTATYLELTAVPDQWIRGLGEGWE